MRINVNKSVYEIINLRGIVLCNLTRHSNFVSLRLNIFGELTHQKEINPRILCCAEASSYIYWWKLVLNYSLKYSVVIISFVPTVNVQINSIYLKYTCAKQISFICVLENNCLSAIYLQYICNDLQDSILITWLSYVDMLTSVCIYCRVETSLCCSPVLSCTGRKTDPNICLHGS